MTATWTSTDDGTVTTWVTLADGTIQFTLRADTEHLARATDAANASLAGLNPNPPLTATGVAGTVPGMTATMTDELIEATTCLFCGEEFATEAEAQEDGHDCPGPGNLGTREQESGPDNCHCAECLDQPVAGCCETCDERIRAVAYERHIEDLIDQELERR